MSSNKIMVSFINKPKYTPAITIVEECNNAEIGVGADIAFNNHEQKGIWADFENIMMKSAIVKQNISEKQIHNLKKGNDKKG